MRPAIDRGVVSVFLDYLMTIPIKRSVTSLFLGTKLRLILNPSKLYLLFVRYKNSSGHLLNVVG